MLSHLFFVPSVDYIPRQMSESKTTVFLADMSDFAAFNAVYAEVVEEPFPARSTVEVAALPRGALIEIDAIAVKGSR